MKPPNIVTVHFLSAKWSKKLFTINHYELQNGKCIVTQELSAYEYLESLEEKETFKKLTRSIRSQLKRAVKLYAEYEQGSHCK